MELFIRALLAISCKAGGSLLQYGGCPICSIAITKVLSLVVLQRESQLLDGPVAGSDRINPVSTEVVTRVLHVRLRALEGRDGFPNLWMGLAPLPSRCGLRRNWPSWDGHALNGGDG
jgi:hypothetical protein